MAGRIDEIKEQITCALSDSTKPWKKTFDLVEQKTGVPRLYIFIGGAALVAIYLTFGYAAQFLCNLISVAYPAYVSMKAIETSSKDDDTKWLTYWVTFSVFSLVEHFSPLLLKFIPFYWLLKCCFFIWCMLPIENNGATIMYTRVIRPRFLKHQAATDEALNQVFGKAKKIVGDVITTKKD